jgi:hypothetical protein
MQEIEEKLSQDASNNICQPALKIEREKDAKDDYSRSIEFIFILISKISLNCYGVHFRHAESL